jgi:hypothetical protein
MRVRITLKEIWAKVAVISRFFQSQAYNRVNIAKEGILSRGYLS